MALRAPLPACAIELWFVPTELGPRLMRRIRPLLDPCERKSARAFRSIEAARGFVVARAALKCLAGRTCGRSARLIRIARSPSDKPSLAGRQRMGISLSHADGMVAVAVAPGRSIGVDIERVVPLPELMSLAASALAPAERRGFDAISGRRRVAAFYDAWVRKEAVVKADGCGFSVPPGQISVGPGRRLAASPRGRRLRIETLAAPPGYAAALAWGGARQAELRIRSVRGQPLR